MLVLAVAVLLGLVAGLIRPALGARCQRIRIDRLPLLAIGAAGAVGARLAPTEVAPLAMGAALAVLLGFALSNAHVTGVAVIGVGLLLNLISVVVNNGIPVRAEALITAGVVERDAISTVDLGPIRHFEAPTDRLGGLGDTVPIGAAKVVLSFGDLIVLAGVADAVRDLARRRRRAWTLTDRVDYDSTMTQLRVVHDWGTAPSAPPASADQYSANPDRSVPVTIDLTSADPTSGAPPLVAATHIK
ncbi:MAG: DUF5317 family protein [Acidimicrobiales bacterium]